MAAAQAAVRLESDGGLEMGTTWLFLKRDLTPRHKGTAAILGGDVTVDAETSWF